MSITVCQSANASKASETETNPQVSLISPLNQNDRLEILKANCDQEIQETEDKLRVLKAKRASLVLLAQESEKLANPKSEPDRYANMGLTDTILDVVERLKDVSIIGSNTSQIRDYMIAYGFPLSENPHNFGIAVATTLQRLTGQRRVRKTRNNWGNFYNLTDTTKKPTVKTP